MKNKNGQKLTEIGRFEVGAPKKSKKKRKWKNSKKKLKYIQVDTNLMKRL